MCLLKTKVIKDKSACRVFHSSCHPLNFLCARIMKKKKSSELATVQNLPSPKKPSGKFWTRRLEDHLEICIGYSELWKGLGPMTPRSRVRYFIRVKNKRVKMSRT